MRLHVLIVLAIVLSACSAVSDGPTPEPEVQADAGASADPAPLWPPVPDAPTGALPPEVSAAVDRLLSSVAGGSFDSGALDTMAASDDPRLGWLISDILRLVPAGTAEQSLVDAFRALTSVDPNADARFGTSSWQAVTNLLIGWDLPAPPGYRDMKARLFLLVEPSWAPFFADEDAEIDWRWISWGGVLIDDRPLGDADPCPRGCIPALDDPSLTPASDGAWYA
ncbi:MAG: hypothetical protein ACR2I5_02290, partial [Candidatus Limnocylindria bacterium]